MEAPDLPTGAPHAWIPSAPPGHDRDI